MLTLTKQTNGNYHLGFATPADRKEFIENYNLEKADALIHSQEWEQASWEIQWNLFVKALENDGINYYKGSDWELICDALEKYFSNGFTNLTNDLRDDFKICFIDDECEYPFDDNHELLEVKEWWQEDTSWHTNLIEVILTKAEIVFHKMTDSTI